MDLFDVASLVAAPAPRLRLRKGTVVSVQGATITVTVAGSAAEVAGVKYLSSLCPKAGAGVWLATDGLDLFALGTLAPTGPAAVCCTKTADGTMSDGTYERVNWNGTSYDTHGMWDTVNRSRVYARVPGIYLVQASICWAANATGHRILLFRRNGAGDFLTWDRRLAITGGVATVNNCALTLAMAAGDYIEAQCYQTSGAGLAVIADTRSTMQATWLRPPA